MAITEASTERFCGMFNIRRRLTGFPDSWDYGPGIVAYAPAPCLYVQLLSLSRVYVQGASILEKLLAIFDSDR